MSKEKYLDEKIIKMIDQAENPEAIFVVATDKKTEVLPKARTIYTGIKYNGQWIEFEARPLIDNKITMMVPKEFAEMEPEKAKIKYPSEQRPETILTDYTGSINILFSYMDLPMTDDVDAAKLRDQLSFMMRRVNPGIKIQSTGEEVVGGKDVAYFEFTNPALDGKLYNLMFFLELDGRPLMGTFNCLTKAMKYWKDHAFEMMRSIKIIIPESEETTPQATAIDL